jgi:putative ABC transport system ATP-binding protein
VTARTTLGGGGGGGRTEGPTAAEAVLLALDVGLAYREAGGFCHALRGVRLGLRAPGCVGIAGPSGSGKSSLLYVLAGLKRPTAGRVLALGQDLGRLTPAARCALRRRYFGFVFQQPFLIHFLTAAENVVAGALRPDAAARRRAELLLRRLGLARYAQRLPHELSGGQRQRVAAARALMNDPLVVFADEPTASLDHAAGAELMGLLHEYRRARGALLAVVSHDETVIAGADAVVRMWDGEVLRIEPARARPAPAGEACRV